MPRDPSSPHRRLAAFLALAGVLAPPGVLAQVDAPAAPPPAPPPQSSAAPPSPAGASSSEPRRRRVQLVGIAGYQLNTDVNTSAGHVSVSDEPVYGAAVAMETVPGTWAEVMWLYSEPTVRASGSPLLTGSSPLKVATHYFQIGGTRGVQRGRAEVYGGATLGAVLFIPGTLHYANGDSTSLGSTWRFAFTAGGGARLDLSRRLALRFDLRATAPIYFTGGSLYAGSGGAGLTVSGGIPLWQFDFLGALVLML